MASQSSRSAGPFATSPPASSAVMSTTTVVASCVVAPNVPIGFQRFVGCASSQGHPAHVGSLSGPRTRRGMRPVIRRRPCSEGPVPCLRFPVAFRLPPFASWPSCPATDIRFPRGRPTGGWSCPPDRDGVSMFRTGETRPVSGAPSTPGPWCSPGRHRYFSHHCHLPAAGPVLRCCTPPAEVLGNEACRGSRHSPFRSSPCL